MNQVEVQMLDALRVIALTPGIRAHLEAQDPMALRQVERAISAAETSESALDDAMERLFADADNRLEHEMGGALEWDDPVGGAR